jgi:hypothetical protein
MKQIRIGDTTIDAVIEREGRGGGGRASLSIADMARGPACCAEPLILSKTRFLRKRFRTKTSAGL